MAVAADHPPLRQTQADPHAVFDAAWRARACRSLDAAGVALLTRAVEWVSQALPSDAHTSMTGEPLTVHGAGVVEILAALGADAPTRASALLAALPVDLHAANLVDAPLRQAFDAEVITLVQGARALLRLGLLARQSRETNSADQQEMQRKMLLAMAADLRIVLLRLASRLQSLRWYTHVARACPPAFAQETLDLYTPLANRLGIWQLKWEMEDLALRALEPQTYKEIAARLEEKRAEREAFIAQVVKTLQQALRAQHITAEVSGRPKHIYSIWNKMRNKRLDFARLYDLRALRVIVDDERTCYAVLALAHSLWTPVPEEFDDYISRPKPNGYRSLHTVVRDAQGKAFEVQIRTRAMHDFAEYGMAAHWRYKEAGAKGGQVAASSGYDQKVAWMRQLLAWDHAASAGQDPAQHRDAALHNGAADSADAAHGATAKPTRASQTARARPIEARIYVMTPQARVIELPEGATPIDFAYALHTDLGHRCRGARVDGQMVPLLTRLKTGQTVEITAAKSGGPSRDWLNPQLGFLASPRARAKVRAWFNAVELQQRISQGQALVEKELQRLGKTLINLEQLAHTLGFAKADDLYVAVAKEEFSLRQIDQLLRARAPTADEQPHLTLSRPQSHNTAQSSVLVVGVDALLTQLARCCRPAPPDDIAGFVTRGRGVSIHRANCAAFAALQTRHPERIIPVAWGNTTQASYPVDIHVQAQDHPGLLHDLSEVFSRLRLRVIGVNTQSRRSLAQMQFTVEVSDGQQLDKALAALNDVPGVRARRR